MQQRSLFDAATLDAVLARIESLTPETRPQWGSMDVAQMLAHCAEVQEVSNGKPLETPWYLKLFGGLIKRAVVSPKPYARGLRTAPQYVKEGPEDFETQRERLRRAVMTMVEAGPEKAAATPHPLFGNMTAEEKGWAMYKHLDHHLSQFGV